MIDEETFLKWIIHADKTPKYKYGEGKHYDGKKVKKSEYILTPKELARLRLNEIIKNRIVGGGE